MTTVTKSFNPTDIFQGPCDVYLGVTPPVSAVPPVSGTNTLTLDQFGQPPIASTGQINGTALTAGGTGYSIGDTLTVVQSGGSVGMIRVLSLGASNAVATFAVINGGQGYATASGLATTGGTGSGCTIQITSITAGFHLGLTQGPASVNLTPKFTEIKADQFSAPVDAIFSSFAAEFDFTVKQYDLVNLQKYFAGLFSATQWTLTAGSTNPARKLLQIGSSFSSQAKTASLLLVGPRRDSPNKFLYAMGYKTHIKSAIAMGPIQRGKEAQFKLKFGCLLDPSRVSSDMTLQICKTPV